MKYLNQQICAIAAVAALFSPIAQADTWTLNFNNAGLYTNNGTNPPLMPGMTDTSTWATLTFTDHGTNVVDITMSVLSGVMQPGPYVNDWWFNGDALAQSASFLNTGGVNANLNICNNCANGSASGSYDGIFNFVNANPGELKQGSSSFWTATVGVGQILSVADFQFLSDPQGSQSLFYAAVHVQGNGVSEKGGACVSGTEGCEPPGTPEGNPTPEPGTLALLGLGLGLLAYRRRTT